jgi:hypothetical protein
MKGKLVSFKFDNDQGNRNLGNLFIVKKCLYLEKELLIFFSFEIVLSSNWHAYDYDISYQTTIYIHQKYIFFLVLFYNSYVQKFSSHCTGKMFAVKQNNKELEFLTKHYPFRIHWIVQPHLNKPGPPVDFDFSGIKSTIGTGGI